MPDTSTEVAIATTTLGSAASTITFSSIPATYTDLVITVNTTLSAEAYLLLRYNSITTGYYSTQLYGDGAGAPTTARNANTTSMYLAGRSQDGTTNPIFHKINIFSYASSTFRKSVLSEGAQDSNGVGSVQRIAGVCNANNTAITGITLLLSSGNFGAGTVATIYGIL
jgi:hypothetical protein